MIKRPHHNFLADLKALNPLTNAGANARHFMADACYDLPVHPYCRDRHAYLCRNAAKGNPHATSPCQVEGLAFVLR